ncbi:MAG: hypothetical protein V4517_01400 [Pseudomonadota bacterium]
MLMPRSSRRPVQMALLCALAAAIGSAPALAQSGSAGGSIGNDEKSVSGSRQAPRSVETEKPARRSKPAAEKPRRAARESSGGGGGGGGNFDGAWVAHSMGTPCGAATERFVISSGRISGELSSGQVSPNGSTTSGGSASGLSWNSTGRFAGRSGSGTFVRSDGCRGRWTASKL